MKRSQVQLHRHNTAFPVLSPGLCSIQYTSPQTLYLENNVTLCGLALLVLNVNCLFFNNKLSLRDFVFLIWDFIANMSIV